MTVICEICGEPITCGDFPDCNDTLPCWKKGDSTGKCICNTCLIRKVKQKGTKVIYLDKVI